MGKHTSLLRHWFLLNRLEEAFVLSGARMTCPVVEQLSPQSKPYSAKFALQLIRRTWWASEILQ
jgi:hypothetical protein